jgi:hypothetical protein
MTPSDTAPTSGRGKEAAIPVVILARNGWRSFAWMLHGKSKL